MCLPNLSVSADVSPIGTTVVDGYLYERRDDQNIWLIDTPGFDDTSKANAKVLREIASSMCTFWDDKCLSIGGLIYVHRITDIRMSGSSLKSIRIFEALCGEGCFDAVTVVTTMWDDLQTETARNAAETRESTLRSRLEFFGHLIEKGAVFQRLEYPTKSSIAEQVGSRKQYLLCNKKYAQI